MTFKTTVRNAVDKSPIMGLVVFAADEMNGAGFPRSTDGNGYADVAMLNAKVGDRITLFVLDPEYRFKGKVMGDALVVSAEDQVLEIELDPFA